ncbi:MAG: (2Fe-2S)-binding protein [Gammaproteobacteria bacterium]|nr:(2Fe-2S)-binding protein [Gammaproteobacteria bacterium]
MKQIVPLHINGDIHEVAIEPGATLLRVLREHLGLIGTKRGCDSGGCGCCTVHLDGKAVYSCMTFALQVAGRKITTIEGLSPDGRLNRLQDAFVEAGAVQCGYCTCGMIMAAQQLLDVTQTPTEEEIRRAIAGNLCRCTGYHKIVAAIKLASAP